MSSEQERQYTPERRRPSRPTEAPGAAELARAGGYDPDDPATWPGNAPADPAGIVPGAAPAARPEDGEPFKLTDAKGMRALAHPVRMALLELFSYRETLTATQASEALGESPANCAFHLRTLAKYGFVREAGGGKGRERPWALVNRSLDLDPDQEDPQAALAATELGVFWLDRWMERARRVFGSRDKVPGWKEATGWMDTHVFLTAEEAAELRTEMSRMLSRYDGRVADPALRPEGALPVEWTIFVTPVPEAAELAGPER